MRLSLEMTMERYGLSVFRSAYSILNDTCEAEDVAQEVFLAYYQSQEELCSEEHLKAWLLRVAMNKAKNIATSFWKRNKRDIDSYTNTLIVRQREDQYLLDTLASLPLKCRAIMHLFYYEDYSVREIAGIMKEGENTVKSQLSRGRSLMKQKLKEEWSDDE